MQTSIIWKGRLYHSTENCILTTTAIGNEITSTITGDYKNQMYKVDYHIKTNKNWETTFVRLESRIDNSNESLILEKKEEMWLLNSNPHNELKNLFDVDISLTPFTNTLPINRLQLKDTKPQIIEVIYFDILEKEIKPVKQIYTKLSPHQYIYENYDKSFKAEITIDPQGLVVEYPTLFEMTAKHQINIC